MLQRCATLSEEQTVRLQNCFQPLDGTPVREASSIRSNPGTQIARLEIRSRWAEPEVMGFPMEIRGISATAPRLIAFAPAPEDSAPRNQCFRRKWLSTPQSGKSESAGDRSSSKLTRQALGYAGSEKQFPAINGQNYETTDSKWSSVSWRPIRIAIPPFPFRRSVFRR